MNLNDNLYFTKKTLIKNKKEWIQIIIFAFLILLLLVSLTAFYSYRHFGNTMLRDSINAHKLSIYGLSDESEEIKNIINMKDVEAIKKEYETYARAYVNSTMVEFYSIPNNINFVSKKITTLKKGEMIASNELELEINGKKLKGKKLIGQTVQISTENINITNVKIIDVIDSAKYGYGISKDSAFLSESDMISIANTQNELLGEYMTVGDIHIAFINDSKDVNKVYNQIENMNISVNYMINADTKMIQKIYKNIFTLLFISALIFFLVKILYLYNYLNKEKKYIVMYLICGYTYKDVFNIYALKKFICSILSILLSEILYFIFIVLYNNLKKELVAVGLKATLPIYILVIIWLAEIIINISIIKMNFKKIEKTKISEYIRND